MSLNPVAMIERQRREAVRRLTKAAVHVTNAMKVKLSVPAPRERVTGRDGSVYYRATVPATPGAPPRKLSGRLRASIAYRVNPDSLTAVVGTPVVYGPVHEYGNHPFARITLAEERGKVNAILRGE